MAICPQCKTTYPVPSAKRHCVRCGAKLPISDEAQHLAGLGNQKQPSPAPDLRVTSASPERNPLIVPSDSTRVTESLPDLKAGKLAHYTIVEQLGGIEGLEMSSLVQANGRYFLLKQHLSASGLPNIQDIQLFRQECQYLQSIAHHGLPVVVEFFTDQNTLNVVLDRLPGVTLRKNLYPTLELAGATTVVPVLPPPDQLIYWAEELAKILLMLHEQRPFPRIHGNLTPDTIFVSNTGELSLCDPGLLHSFSAIHARNGRERVKPGKWADPSLPHVRAVHIASDIFAYGRLLDFLLTGAEPTERSMRPRVLDPKFKIIDPQLRRAQQIVARCCAPQDRYIGMHEVLEALSSVQGTARVSAHKIPCSCGELNPHSARFCRRCSSGLRTHSANRITLKSAHIVFDEARQNQMLEAQQAKHFAPLYRFQLREQLDEIQTDPGFDQLLCLDALSEVHKLPHQQEAALRVLKHMRGRALLADEVGLGKTIEAALVLKELLQRRQAEKILILCPPSVALQMQWQSELYEKFNEVFLVMGLNIDTTLAWSCPQLIAPYTSLSQRSHAEEMQRQHYDLVILDEAHYLNEPANQHILRVIQNLRKKYFLLVSATPMHNDIHELYNIVTLLRPGHFGSWEDFRQQYVDPSSDSGLKDTSTLRDILKQVMIRNVRSEVMQRYQDSQQVDFRFPKRRAIRFDIEMSNPEARAFYAKFRAFYQKNAKRVRNQHFLYHHMAELVERLISSRAAFVEQINLWQRDICRQLGNQFFSELEEFAASYPAELVRPKIKVALEQAQAAVNSGSKVLIFSQFNATTKALFNELYTTPLGKYCHIYDEKATSNEKDASLRRFILARSGIMFCPAEISEGVNLQFANVMINLDLPWDPMKIEQRIGRIQRLGSKFEEVVIINLVLRDTIEEEILYILEHKLNMFALVVGQLEEIIGSLSDQDDPRRTFTNIYLDTQVETAEGERISPTKAFNQAIDEALNRTAKSTTMDHIFISVPSGEADDEYKW